KSNRHSTSTPPRSDNYTATLEPLASRLACYCTLGSSQGSIALRNCTRVKPHRRRVVRMQRMKLMQRIAPRFGRLDAQRAGTMTLLKERKKADHLLARRSVTLRAIPSSDLL